MDWKNKDECWSSGFESSGPLAPFYAGDSYEPGDNISEWLQPMKNREFDCRHSIGCNECPRPTDTCCNFRSDLTPWLAPIGPMESMGETRCGALNMCGLINLFKEPNLDHRNYGECSDTTVDKWLPQSTKCKNDFSRCLSPSDPCKMDQSDQGQGQTIFGVYDSLEKPKWQSTPLISTGSGLYAERSLHVESLECEIKDLKDALSRKNEAFLSLENDFETMLNKLDASEQKCKKSESKASNTIESANGEIEIANNYIEMLKKQLLEKDERIHSLQKEMTAGQPKRMSAPSVRKKFTKVKVHESSLNQGATSGPSSGKIQMSHTLSDGMSVSDKPDGPGLSKSDTDISHQNDGKPAVKIKHYSFSSYLDKRSKEDMEKCQQIRYYLNQCTDMMERLNQSSDPSDLGHVKTLEQVMQHLTENLSVLENPGNGDLQTNN